MFGLFEKTFAPQIRRLDVDDGAACATLHANAFAFPWPQGDIEALLLERNTVADGAFGSKTDDLQGFILCRLAADEAEVLTIAVAARKRRKGLAGRLLAANIARLSVLGAKSLFLEVEAENTPARALYQRFGFETVGERKSYYRKEDGSAALAYIMRRVRLG